MTSRTTLAFRNEEQLLAAVADPRRLYRCLLYTSDAADERSSVDLGGRRIIKKKQHVYIKRVQLSTKAVSIAQT